MLQSKRYNYSCTKCQGPVVKTPTGPGATKGKAHGLHGWSCEICGQGVKVNREMK